MPLLRTCQRVGLTAGSSSAAGGIGSTKQRSGETFTSAKPNVRAGSIEGGQVTAAYLASRRITTISGWLPVRIVGPHVPTPLVVYME